MKSTFAILAAALVLAACASQPAGTATDAKTVAAATPAGEKSLEGQVTTGSRLKRGTERAVRVIGNEEYKDSNDVRSIGNAVGARSN